MSLITLDLTPEELGVVIYGVTLVGLANASVGLSVTSQEEEDEVERTDQFLLALYDRLDSAFHAVVPR